MLIAAGTPGQNSWLANCDLSNECLHGYSPAGDSLLRREASSRQSPLGGINRISLRFEVITEDAEHLFCRLPLPPKLLPLRTLSPSASPRRTSPAGISRLLATPQIRCSASLASAIAKPLAFHALPKFASLILRDRFPAFEVAAGEDDGSRSRGNHRDRSVDGPFPS